MSEKVLGRLMCCLLTVTNVYNRVRFNDIIKGELGRAKRYKRPLSLSIFDIDGFKRINGTFGHNTGDYILSL